jgi:2-methylfumaryl-CoA isomerase
VDYTVNPAVGFPIATGPEGSTEPVGHALPAWDCITGQQAAMAIIAADRHRRKTGKGQLIELALKDTALAMLGNLGIIGEASINGSDRPKMGNSLFGAYAQDFVCQDGQRVMVVALTDRQWRNLKAATDTVAEMADLAQRLNADLDQEGERFIHRHAITSLLKPFFEARTLSDVAASLAGSDVTWSQYRTFKQAVEEDPDCSLDNPMFAMLNQPGIGSYLMPGSPIHFMGVDRLAPAPAPILGEHTLEILTEIGFSNTEIATLHDIKIVASPK